MSVSHWAGPPAEIAGRIIQRCAICGEKLLDNLNVGIPVGPDGQPGTFATWEPGRFVRWSGEQSRSETIVQEERTDDGRYRLPADCCLNLGMVE